MKWLILFVLLIMTLPAKADWASAGYTEESAKTYNDYLALQKKYGEFLLPSVPSETFAYASISADNYVWMGPSSCPENDERLQKSGYHTIICKADICREAWFDIALPNSDPCAEE